MCDPEALKPTLRIDIFTLFPAMFDGPFSESIVKRAIASGTIAIGIHDIREWATDKHRTADDTPYGGGAGMVIKAPPVIEAVESVLGDALESTRIAIMSAAGTATSSGSGALGLTSEMSSSVTARRRASKFFTAS